MHLPCKATQSRGHDPQSQVQFKRRISVLGRVQGRCSSAPGASDTGVHLSGRGTFLTVRIQNVGAHNLGPEKLTAANQRAQKLPHGDMVNQWPQVTQLGLALVSRRAIDARFASLKNWSLSREMGLLRSLGLDFGVIQIVALGEVWIRAAGWLEGEAR
jgi:hypothetical protein